MVREQEIEHVVFRECDKIVFKLDGSAQGKGIHFFDRESFDCGLIKSLGNGVIQKFIVQHPLLSTFAPNSAATLRLTTAVDNLGRTSRAAFCALAERVIPTSGLTTKSACRWISVTGELAREGFPTDWGATEEHPDSKARFAGLKMPAFNDCVDTVLQLHSKVPFARCIGWDVTVDSDGKVQVMEWNGEHNDVKFREATQGPCFSDLKWEPLNASPL